MNIAIVANTSWYIYNFRRNLIRALRASGEVVYAIAPRDSYSSRVEEAGAIFIDWSVSQSGRNPAVEALSAAALRRKLSSLSIDLVLSFTPKGNVYSGLAALGTRTATLPNISGLGVVFSSGGALASLVKGLYAITLRRAPIVFFQNDVDRDQFITSGLVRPEHARRIMGSGVDLSQFRPLPLPCGVNEGQVVFLMVARLLREKGVELYAKAAREVKRDFPGVKFRLLGPLATGASNAVRADEIELWHSEGAIEYLGTTDQVASVIADADCLVLPSYYREGVPRSLLEGAAMGRPCITTDMPGCRDVIETEVTGYLCQPRDLASLIDALRSFIGLTYGARQRMGTAARARAERLFDERAIIREYGSAVDQVKSADRRR